MMRADLHTHSTASDGTLAPSRLVSLAAEQSVDVLAITDHDSVAGVSDALAAGLDHGVQVIPAVELSAADGDLDVHLLAYFVDITDADFLAVLNDLRDVRRRRATVMVQALCDAGYDVSMRDVLALADGASIGRGHIGRVLVAAGHAGDMADAFNRLIGRGRPFYQPKDTKSPEDLVALIRDFGAIPVLAHPGITAVDHRIASMVEAGLLGIEVYHSDHTLEQTVYYAGLAERLGLLATGGSDYHGPGVGHAELGVVAMTESEIERFLAAGSVRRKPAS